MFFYKTHGVIFKRSGAYESLDNRAYSGFNVEEIVKNVRKSFKKSDLSKPLSRGSTGRIEAKNFQYHPRIKARALNDPVAHNFPYSFDKVILKTKPIKQADGSLLYRQTGILNGKQGIYEIGLNPDTGIIFHRTFKGGRS